jgi:hypothetical protein
VILPMMWPRFWGASTKRWKDAASVDSSTIGVTEDAPTRSVIAFQKPGEHRREDHYMCRSIKTLYNVEPAANEQETHDAALQFVRKISGYRKPSQANEAAFATAVDEIAAISWRLLGELETAAPRRERVASPA